MENKFCLITATINQQNFVSHLYEKLPKIDQNWLVFVFSIFKSVNKIFLEISVGISENINVGLNSDLYCKVKNIVFVNC